MRETPSDHSKLNNWSKNKSRKEATKPVFKKLKILVSPELLQQTESWKRNVWQNFFLLLPFCRSKVRGVFDNVVKKHRHNQWQELEWWLLMSKYVSSMFLHTFGAAVLKFAQSASLQLPDPSLNLVMNLQATVVSLSSTFSCSLCHLLSSIIFFTPDSWSSENSHLEKHQQTAIEHICTVILKTSIVQRADSLSTVCRWGGVSELSLCVFGPWRWSVRTNSL